jgi:hypothetical protein
MLRAFTSCRAASLVLAGLLAFPGGLAAFVSHRCTDTMKLDGSANLGSKPPAPVFKLPGVSVKKCLDVDSDASATEGKATQTCHFQNSGSSPATFIFCDMVELSSAAATKTIDNPCNMGFDNTAKKWLCTKDAPTSVFGRPGAHFGCQVVTLGPAGSPDSVFTTPPLSVTSKDFKGKHAWDFQVSYADAFNLDVDGAVRPFDDSTCGGCFGANKAINFDISPVHPPRALATGYWVMSDVPITDPFVRWQELDGTLHPSQYASLAAGPAVPGDFPVEVPGVQRTSPQVEPPLAYDLDLLLWDIHTMSAPPEEVLAARVDVYTGGQDEGRLVQISAEPRETLIPGGSMEYGRITIQQFGGTAGTVPEGTRVPFSVAVVEPAAPLRQCWEQDGRAIQDTLPAFVTDHRVVFDGDSLAVSIDATDVTTTVLAANFFYSLDGGPWQVHPLRSTADTLSDPGTNSFTGAVPLGGAQGSLEYFFSVQDGVLNLTWFGTGEVALFPDCNDNGVDDAIDVASGASADIDNSGRPDECEVGAAFCLVRGTAVGGQVDMQVAGFPATCSLSVTTTAGQSGPTVAAALAAACTVDPCFVAEGITCSSAGEQLTVRGFRVQPGDLTIVSADAGIVHVNEFLSIPALGPAGAAALAFLLLTAGIAALRR